MSLELKGITKRFPGVLANDNVNISVETGEIVALLGENGAGKTTLMNILYGLYTPDEGEVFVDGKPLQLSSSADSIAAGIGMVHQHFMLVPVFTVTENVILGMEPANSVGWLDQKTGSQIVEDISGRYNLQVDPDAFIEDLPVGVQQRVEIIKVLRREARYVIFDEPTSVLTPQEVE
jgi:simple sugar transport system ATP-binding protein